MTPQTSPELRSAPRPDARPAPRQDRSAPAPGDQWHIIDYLRLVSKRRWTAIPAFLVVVVGVGIATYAATPIFEARAQLLIEAETQNIVMFKEVVEQESSTAEYYNTQYKILQSRALARTTIEQLKLWNNPEIVRQPDDTSQGGASAYMTKALRTVEGSLTRLLGPQRADAIYDAPKPKEGVSAEETATQSRAIQGFLDHLTITPVRGSRLVDVKFQSTEPRLAAAVANALAQAYIDRILEFKLSTSKEAAVWLANQLSEQRAKVEESEKLVQQYREKNTALSTEDAQVLQKITEASALVTRAKTERLQKELLFKQIQSARGDRAALMSFPVVVSNPTIVRLNLQLSQLREQEVQLSRDFGDLWPQLITARTDIKALQEKLDVELDNVIKLIGNEVQSAKAQEDGFVEALEVQKTEVLARNRTAIGYQTLEREAQSNRQIFETLMQRAKETNISSQLRTNNIRLADEANAPLSPVWPNRPRNLLFAIFGGMGLAIALAFGVEYMDNKLKSPDEIRDHLGLKCLGLVPKLPNPPKGAPRAAFLLNNGVPPMFAEAFRAVRTNVLFSFEGGGHATERSIVVTSTAPGEGKTLVASNLALGLALAGQRVLLIDADMRQPRVHEVFGLQREPGLSGLLTMQVKPSESIRRSEVPGLWLLTSGLVPSNPAELLSSQRFRSLIEVLTRQFDWVIVDSPPIMAVIDASVIAHAAGGVLFVIAAEKTSRPAAIKALEQLDIAKASFLGAVLNQVDVKRNAFYYSPYFRREYAEYYGRSAS